MDAVPADRLAAIEEALVQRVVTQEGVSPDTLFYDTMGHRSPLTTRFNPEI
jgi:hypothetical protein